MMEHQYSNQAQPESHDPPQIQQAKPSNGWNPDPIAATPYIDSPSSPPRTARVAFAPANPPDSDNRAGGQAPSSIGLGIDSVAQSPGYQAFHGYLPVYSRDPFQVFPNESDTQLGDCSSKAGFQQQEHLISSPDAPAYYYYPQQYGSSPPPEGPDNSGSSRWPRWRWVGSAWPMYGMFSVGVICAGAHHIFYNHLDGMPADNQMKMVRIGGLLSYGSKASLLAAVIFAYKQQAWVTARRKVLRLRSIDSLFAAITEPLALLNWEFIKMAKVAVALAVLVW